MFWRGGIMSLPVGIGFLPVEIMFWRVGIMFSPVPMNFFLGETIHCLPEKVFFVAEKYVFREEICFGVAELCLCRWNWIFS
jgi:hypothetical protein